MTALDPYISVGAALELLAQSKYHKQHDLRQYFSVEIMPALRRNQMRLYMTDDGVATALVTWAWLSKEVEEEIHKTGRALTEAEWTCGDRLFFNDWVTPYGNLREVVRDMTETAFPDQVASSLRRHMDGTVRRVNRWTGKSVREKQKSQPQRKTAAFSFAPIDDYPALKGLTENWRLIRDEMRAVAATTLPINRDGKSHADVAAEVADYVQEGGAYGWLQGWGNAHQRENWTQLGLVTQDTPVPFLNGHMSRTLDLLQPLSGIKIAALLKMQPGTFLETHSHPELAEEGLLQMHLTLEAAPDRNFAYLNVDGEFRQHIPGTAFVFDGSKPHFAVNASDAERVILYLEFDPQQTCLKTPSRAGKDAFA
ncbi:MAG: toxin-activating lysine-acyltransferase [Pseudomonadota bacterium]